MDTLFIPSRAAVTDAAQLIDAFGDDAGLEAAARAEDSRGKGNVIRFCHGRHQELQAFLRVAERLLHIEQRDIGLLPMTELYSFMARTSPK